MKFFFSFVLLVGFCYLLLAAAIFVFQRNLLYYPVPHQPGVPREEIIIQNNNLNLHGWVLNKGQQKAIIYFGGNAEAIQNNITSFESIFKNYTVYLIHYRGYGKSEGKPTESGLFSDALAIYDAVQSNHQALSVMGRSLGSGVAVYLASKRRTEKLILLTPYDSIAEVAQVHYPFLPARIATRDRFESFRYAKDIIAPVLMITAERDRIVPAERALKLREYLTATRVEYHSIKSATHNDISNFPEYSKTISEFVD